MTSVAVTLYTKPDCSLCDRLRDDLSWIGEEIPLAVETRNILDDPDWTRQFGVLIPVLEIGGVFYYPPHDLPALRRTLESAQQNAVR